MLYSVGLADSWGYDTPEQYAAALNNISPGLATTVNAQSLSTGTDWVNAAMDVVGKVALSAAQIKLLNAQVSRAKAGLAPLDASQYGIGANVNVGVAQNTQNLVLYALGAGALVILLTSFMKHGRSSGAPRAVSSAPVRRISRRG